VRNLKQSRTKKLTYVTIRVDDNIRTPKKVIPLELGQEFMSTRGIRLRKRNKPSITLLSGPHVHKKARDQYKVERCSTIYRFDGGNTQLAQPGRALSDEIIAAGSATYSYSRCECFNLPYSINGKVEKSV